MFCNASTILALYFFLDPLLRLCSVQRYHNIVITGHIGLWITTDCGKLQVSSGEIVVLPQGFRFTINLPDGPSRGYVAEIFGTHFQLPDLGPIGT